MPLVNYLSTCGMQAVGTILSAFLPVTTAVAPAMNAWSKSESSSLRPANFASTQIAQNSATCRQTTSDRLFFVAGLESHTL
jgi:hypothetical protein